MQITALSLMAGLLATASAMPASKIFARHDECAYAATTGGVRYSGTCTSGGNYGAGACVLGGLSGEWGCDFQYHTADNTPCYDAAQSQYACKADGDPCWAYSWAEDAGSVVVHCTNQ